MVVSAPLFPEKRLFMFSKWILSAFLIAPLMGCQSISSDMLNNDFVSVRADHVPSEMQGVWTGSMGPYLVTLSLQGDGHGLYCYTYNASEAVYKAKYSQGVMVFQDGTKMEVSPLSGGRLRGRVNYLFGQDYTFYQDPELKEAANFCSRELRGRA